MTPSNTYKSVIRLILVIIGIISCLSVCSSLASEAGTEELRWDQERIRDYPIYHLLIKARSAGSGMTEEAQWDMAKDQGEPFVDEQREDNLKELLDKYPDSEYADDAALLLARAKYFYHNDANGAIEDLYKVITKYPEGTWIAEDILFLERAMLRDINYGWYGRIFSPQEIDEKIPEPARESEMGTWTMVQEELAYFEHWEKHPNLTSEEARYWIAKIILYADLEDKYDEAITNLKEVIKAHQSDNRAKTDLLESRKQYGRLILTKFRRTERNCYHLLIKTYLDRENFIDAATMAEDYLTIYEEYPSRYEVHREAGEAYEALQQWDKAASHYEEFLSRENLGNATRTQYEQKLNQTKNMGR